MKMPTLIPLCLFAACGFMLHAEDAAGNTDTPVQESKVYYLNVSETKEFDSWLLRENWSTVRAKSQAEAEAAGGAHPESLNLPNDGFIVPARNTERALFTISENTDQDLFLSKIAIVKGEALAGMAMERSWRVNEDGSRTFVAKFTKVGLRIVIK